MHHLLEDIGSIAALLTFESFVCTTGHSIGLDLRLLNAALRACFSSRLRCLATYASSFSTAPPCNFCSTLLLLYFAQLASDKLRLCLRIIWMDRTRKSLHLRRGTFNGRRIADLRRVPITRDVDRAIHARTTSGLRRVRICCRAFRRARLWRLLGASYCFPLPRAAVPVCCPFVVFRI